MIFADSPSLGLLLGGPVVVIALLLAVGTAVYGWLQQKEYAERSFAWDDARLLKRCAIGVFFVILLVAAVAYFPYTYEHHFWIEKSGKVEQVSKRLLPAGDSGMQEKFVLVLDGQPYGVLDTRAALVKPGDQVRINCKKVFEFFAEDGWDCKWGGRA